MVALDVERLDLGIADFVALFVGCGVERALDFQAGFPTRILIPRPESNHHMTLEPDPIHLL